MNDEVKRSAMVSVLWSIAVAGAFYALFSMRRDGVEVIWLVTAALLMAALLTGVPLPSLKPTQKKSGERRVRTWNEKIWCVAFCGIFLLGAMDVALALEARGVLPAQGQKITQSEPPALAIRRASLGTKAGMSDAQRYKYPFMGGVLVFVAFVAFFEEELATLGRDLFREFFGHEASLRRGTQIISLAEARQVADRVRDPNDPGLPWCGVRIPTRSASLNFVAAGKAGSGKSTLIECLLRHVLLRLSPGCGKRVLILDCKMNAVSYLYGLGLKVPIHIFHPLDQRSVAFDIGRDCKSLATCEQFASILIQDEKNGHNRFFTEAPRQLVRSAIVSLLLQSPKNWTLRDVILTLRDPAVLKRLLKRFGATEPSLSLMGSHETALNVLASLMTHECKYETIAAAMAAAEQRLSLEEWLKGESVLVLGLDQKHRVPLGNIYRVVLQRLSELLLSLPDTREVHTFLFLDEVRHVDFPGLGSLMTMSRSKGISIILGFQDIEGMHQAFGEKEANEIVGQASNIALLKTVNPTSSDWSSKVVGESEWCEFHRSFGSQGNGRTEQIVTRPAVLPSEFSNLPAAGPANGIPGWFIGEGVGIWHGPLAWKDIWQPLPAGGNKVPDFLERPEGVQFLRPWTEEERERLGLQNGDGPSSRRPPKHRRGGGQVVGNGEPDID